MILKCEHLGLAYEKQKVVHDVSFGLHAGDCLFIVGENGAGKSTLLKGILGLMKPVEGEIILGEGLRRSQMGYLPQQTQTQKSFPASVREIVLSGCLNHRGLRPFFSKAEKQRAAEDMERLELTGLQKRCYRELSGGQQQRVLLARALCAASRMLLLDEPTAGLDPVITAEFYQLIAQMNQRDGMTVLAVSHDIPAALSYASHILSLGKEDMFFGTVQEYQALLGGEGQ